jgi:hypothetical protein
MKKYKVSLNLKDRKQFVEIVSIKQAIDKGYIKHYEVGSVKASAIKNLMNVSLSKVVAVNSNYIIESL